MQYENNYNIAHENCEKISTKYLWKNENTDEYCRNISSDDFRNSLNNLSIVLENSMSNHDIDENLTHFVQLLDDICSPLFKHNLRQFNFNDNVKQESSQKWFDEECRTKRNIFYTNLNIYRNEKSTINRTNMSKARSNYKKVLRLKRHEFRKQNTNKLLNMRLQNAKEYWKMLKDISHIRYPRTLSANNFARYFNAINNPDDHFFQADDDVIYFNERFLNNEFSLMFHELDDVISDDEIFKAIKQLKNGSSGGPDLLLNEIFKYGAEVLTPYIRCLFQKCFNKGYFPQAWTEGFIVPLHKGGNLGDISNYRGITLLSVFGKLFTRVLNNRLNFWAEKYSVYVEAQAGFRSNMGTIDNIYILNSVISHCFNRNEVLYCAFVDFKKAFDFVVRDILWFKLIKYGVRGKILNVIKSMYNNVKSKVKFMNEVSESFICDLGVRQGECLSPFLFSMYLNDLEETLGLNGVDGIDIGTLKLCILLYADDIVLFANSAEDLQKSLNVLADYCLRWKLVVNTEKTKIMVFRKAGNLRQNLRFFYNGTQIEIVKKYKYLGVMFTSGGAFNVHDKMASGQALKAIYKLNKYLYKFTDILPKHRLDLFDKMISPIISYASEVIGFIQNSNTERIHLQFCKRLLGVKISTPNNFIYGETGRFPFKVLWQINIIKYWLRICASRDTKYAKLIYKSQVDDIVNIHSTKNWALNVKNLLSRLGFYEVWINQGVGDEKFFLLEFKQRVKDIYIQNWHEQLEDSSRALLYKEIATFGYKTYLNIIVIQKYRRSLTILRTCSHRLEIEVGRWHKPHSIPLDERLCKFCNKLEDEFHFVIECPLYAELRKQYIKSYFWKRPNFIKFIELINSENEKIVKSIATFVFKAFERREYLLKYL